MALVLPTQLARGKQSGDAPPYVASPFVLVAEELLRKVVWVECQQAGQGRLFLLHSLLVEPDLTAAGQWIRINHAHATLVRMSLVVTADTSFACRWPLPAIVTIRLLLLEVAGAAMVLLAAAGHPPVCISLHIF